MEIALRSMFCKKYLAQMGKNIRGTAVLPMHEEKTGKLSKIIPPPCRKICNYPGTLLQASFSTNLSGNPYISYV